MWTSCARISSKGASGAGVQAARSSMNTARFVVAMRRGGARTFRRPQLLLAAYSPTVSLPAVLIIVLSAVRVALVAAAAVFKEC